MGANLRNISKMHCSKKNNIPKNVFHILRPFGQCVYAYNVSEVITLCFEFFPRRIEPLSKKINYNTNCSSSHQRIFWRIINKFFITLYYQLHVQAKFSNFSQQVSKYHIFIFFIPGRFMFFQEARIFYLFICAAK